MAGLATNVINVMVFVKQGVTSDSITVSFFAMSLSDLLSSALLIPSPLCSFIDLELSNSMRNHCSLTLRVTNYLHVIFARVTCLIQTYISVERAFSVTFPLHVKHLIKTRNTVIINLVLFMIILAHTLPYLSNVDVIWLQDKDNTTRFIMVENRDARVMSIVNYISMGFVIPSTAIAVNSLATILIIVRLRLMQKWRRTVSSSASVSSKNLEITKTVTVITSMYVIIMSIKTFLIEKKDLEGGLVHPSGTLLLKLIGQEAIKASMASLMTVLSLSPDEVGSLYRFENPFVWVLVLNSPR
uniref:G-protein coupled receptors family 1 profile domain-containing protein n=1 Tax=Biomphalaria glabrata TaxID=6526 RepID=A0A2C9LGV0_BIOGL